MKSIFYICVLTNWARLAFQWKLILKNIKPEVTNTISSTVVRNSGRIAIASTCFLVHWPEVLFITDTCLVLRRLINSISICFIVRFSAAYLICARCIIFILFDRCLSTCCVTLTETVNDHSLFTRTIAVGLWIRWNNTVINNSTFCCI